MRGTPSSRNLRIALAGLAALAVAMGIGRFAFTPVLPMMQQDAGLSLAEGGWLASVNYVGYLVGALWAGATRARGATAIRAGLAVIVLVTLGMALDAGMLAWSVLRAAAGVASAWVLIHAVSWCLERLPPGRPLLVGTVFAGVGAGIVIAGTLCVLLMAAGASASSAWLVLGIASLVATAVLWPVFNLSHEMGDEPGQAHRWTWEQSRMVLAYGAYGFGYIIPATFLPVMARSVVADPAVFGWVWPAFGAAAVVSTWMAALLSRRYGSRAAWIGSQLVMALGVAAPAFWPAVGGILLAALCVGGTFVVITMVGLQDARRVAGAGGSANASRLVAALTAAFAAGQIAGPLAVSAWAGPGGFSAALLMASGLLAAGAALLWAPVRR